MSVLQTCQSIERTELICINHADNRFILHLIRQFIITGKVSHADNQLLFTGNFQDHLRFIHFQFKYTGGPSANMYAMRGKEEKICRRCKRPSCIHPKVCPNLNTDHRPLLDIYHSVDALPGIKKSFIGSGVRYDLLQYQSKDPAVNRSTAEYTRELIANHVSGRLKVAPEHTSDSVLQIMRKPSFSQFYDFKKTFDKINKELNMRQQIIPYFISSHPGCTEEDMAELAVITKKLDFHLEQVQDFTPTPMTVATEAWYTGYHPYTLQPVFSAKSQKEKLAQRMFFFWYKPEERRAIINELRKIGRADLIDKLYGK